MHFRRSEVHVLIFGGLLRNYAYGIVINNFGFITVMLTQLRVLSHSKVAFACLVARMDIAPAQL